MIETEQKWFGRLSVVMALVLPPSLVYLLRDWHVDNWFANAIEVIFVPPFIRVGPPFFLLGLDLLFAAVCLILRKWKYALAVVVLPIVGAWLLTLLLFAFAEISNG